MRYCKIALPNSSVKIIYRSTSCIKVVHYTLCMVSQIGNSVILRHLLVMSTLQLFGYLQKISRYSRSLKSDKQFDNSRKKNTNIFFLFWITQLNKCMMWKYTMISAPEKFSRKIGKNFKEIWKYSQGSRGTCPFFICSPECTKITVPLLVKQDILILQKFYARLVTILY